MNEDTATTANARGGGAQAPQGDDRDTQRDQPPQNSRGAEGPRQERENRRRRIKRVAILDPVRPLELALAVDPVPSSHDCVRSV